MDNWIYILQAGDKLVDPSGKPVPFTPGEGTQTVAEVDTFDRQ